MKTEQYFNLFGRNRAELGYQGTMIPSGDLSAQRRQLSNALTTLGIIIPSSDGREIDQTWSHRQLAEAQGRVWTLRDGVLTPYELTSRSQMHQDMDNGAVFVVRPTHHKNSPQNQADTPEPLQFLFSIRHNGRWAMMSQNSAGLSAMAETLANDGLEDLDNSGGFFRGLADLLISICNWFLGADSQLSTYRHDRTEAQLLDALTQLARDGKDKIFEVGEDSRLIAKDVLAEPKPQRSEPLPPPVPEEELQSAKDPEADELPEYLPLVSEEYKNINKPFPGMKDIHKMGRDLGKCDLTLANQLLMCVTNSAGHQPEIRGLVALLGSTNREYASKEQRKKDGFSADDIVTRLIDIIIDTPETFSSLQSIVDASKNGNLNALDKRVVGHINTKIDPNPKSKMNSMGAVIYSDMRRESVNGDTNNRYAQTYAQRAISNLISFHASRPRLGEHNVKLGQLSWQICRWAFIQNRPLDFGGTTLNQMRGNIILADATRKGLEAQKQMDGGTRTDDLLIDYYTMKVLEQPILAAHMERKGASGLAAGTPEVILALGHPKTGTTMLETIRQTIRDKLSDPTSRQELEGLVSASDRQRDALCQQMYQDSLTKLQADQPSTSSDKRPARRVNLAGANRSHADKLSKSEKKFAVEEVVIENVGRQMHQQWADNIDQDYPNTGRKESFALKAKLKRLDQQHKDRLSGHTLGLYKSYHEYPESQRTSDLPGKPKQPHNNGSGPDGPENKGGGFVPGM